MFSLNQVRHPLPKSLKPGIGQFAWRPRPLVQEPRQPRQTDPFANDPQQAGHGPSFLAFDQAQHYDNEVFPLAFGEAGAKGSQELAQLGR